MVFVVNSVLKRHSAVSCGGIYNFWFHIECINISEDDYESLKNVLPIQGVNWFCRARSFLLHSDQTDVNLVTLQGKINKLLDIVYGLVSDNLVIKNK